MSTTTCPTCGELHRWTWEETFDKFGFGDGDGLVMTALIADRLHRAGYAVSTRTWGCHNTLITSIRHDGQELIPATAKVGYDDPRSYLPPRIVQLLDDAFNDGTEVTP